MATFTVRKDGSGTHTAIQAAIYDASNGDTINIGPGTFAENIEVYKNISLIGSGRDQTILQGKLANDTFVCSWFAGDQIVTTASTIGAIKGKNITGTNVTANSRIDQVVSATELRLSLATPTTGNYTKVVGAYQTVAFSVAPTSGSFKLRYNGVDTAAINWNDSAATIQTKLRAVSGLSTVVVTGTIASKLLNIAFDGVASPVTALSVNSSTLAPSVVVTPTFINGLVSGSATAILPNTTSVAVGHKVEGTGVDATITAWNATTRTMTLSSPITQTGSNVTLTFRLPRTSVTLTQVTNPSSSSPPATIMFVGATTNVVVKGLWAKGFDGTVGQEAAALGITAGSAPGHVTPLFDNCRFTADGDSAVMCGSNPYLDGATWQNCLFDGKTFAGSEPADVPSFSTFVAQGVIQSIGASSSVIRFSDMRGIIVGRTFSAASAFAGSATISAISGNDVTFNKVSSVAVGGSVDCTFTLTAYNVPNCARNLVYIGQNITPNNTKNIVFKNNVINGQSGALIAGSGSKAMFNSAVTIESVGGLVENNLIDGIFGAGQPNTVAANWALRCRQAGIVVQNNVNKVDASRENSGFLIGTEFGETVGTNTTQKPMLVTANQSSGSPLVSFKKADLKAIGKVANDAYFSNESNWKLVSFIYKKLNSAKRLVSGFKDFTASKLMKPKAGMESGDQFELHRVILSDSQRNLLVVERGDVSDVAGYDFTLQSSYAPFLTIDSPLPGATLTSLPIIKGYTTPGAVVTISTGSNSSQVTANSAGLYSLQVPSLWSLANGAYMFTVSMGQIQKTLSLTLNTVIPDSLSLAQVSTFQTLTPTLSGTTTAGKLVSFSDGAKNGSVTADQSGAFSFQVPVDWAYVDQESHTVTASINSGALSQVVTFAIDLPDIVTITSHQASETIATLTPTLAGATTKNVVVTITDGVNSGTVTSNGSGYFSFSIPSGWGWADGQIKTVTAQTPDGHSAQVILTISLPPTITISSPTDGATVNSLSPSIFGSTKPNSLVSLSDGSNSGSVSSDGSGVWSFSTSAWGYTYGQTKTITASLATGQSAQVTITMPQYSWSSATKLADPAGMGTTKGYGGVQFSPSEDMLLVGLYNGLEIYTVANDVFTKQTNPANIPAQPYGISFTPSGSHLAMTDANFGGIYVYTKSGSTLTKLSDLPSQPSQSTMGCAWSSDGQFLAAAGTATAGQGVFVYQRSGNTFTKLTFPNTGLTGSTSRPTAVAWSPDTNYLYVTMGFGSGGSLSVFERSGTSFTRVYVDNVGQAFSVAAASDGVNVAVGLASGIVTYKKTGASTWARQTGAVTGVASGTVRGLEFSQGDKYLACTHDSGDGCTMYSVSNSTFTKITGAFPNTATKAYQIDWSKSGKYIVVGQYDNAGSAKNAIIFKNGQ